jgi:predicted alpha/beta-fold hydrolase
MRKYLQEELRPPHLVHAPLEGSDSEYERILTQVRLLLRDYWPHPVLEFSGYISTFWSGLWAILPTPVSSGPMENLVLSDGGTVSLHWSGEPQQEPVDRVTLVLPGLNNDSRTSFVQETMTHFRSQGFAVATLNYRGVGGVELTSSKLGCLDSWQDLEEVLTHIQTKYPNAKISAVGFSMGGAILLRYLGDAGSSAKLDAAVTIAAPIDVPGVAESLESSLKKRAINFAMATGVKLGALTHLRHRSPYLMNLSIRRVLTARCVRDIDESIICPINGYVNSDEYYTRNSPHLVLSNIKVPTLMVNALDDPVVSAATIPLEEIRRNRKLFLALTRRGGHIGWGSGGLGAACWTDSMAVRFLQMCLHVPHVHTQTAVLSNELPHVVIQSRL